MDTSKYEVKVETVIKLRILSKSLEVQVDSLRSTNLHFVTPFYSANRIAPPASCSICVTTGTHPSAASSPMVPSVSLMPSLQNLTRHKFHFCLSSLQNLFLKHFACSRVHLFCKPQILCQSNSFLLIKKDFRWSTLISLREQLELQKTLAELLILFIKHPLFLEHFNNGVLFLLDYVCDIYAEKYPQYRHFRFNCRRSPACIATNLQPPAQNDTSEPLLWFSLQSSFHCVWFAA